MGYGTEEPKLIFEFIKNDIQSTNTKEVKYTV